MTKQLKFGVMTIQSLPWNKEVERWHLIEALGFDSVWVADHFVDPFQPDSPWFEGWTLLAALASQTKRIRIGTLVTSIPLRNPAILARQALTVDHISNGRLELGLGTGVSGKTDPVHSMIGIEDWPPPERVARLHEALEIIDRCLRAKVTTYEGKYYQVRNAVMAPPPIQKPRPPITIGAMGQSMLKLAARYADTWNSVGGAWNDRPETKLQNIQRQNEFLDDYCERIGRKPETLRRSLLVFGSEAGTAFRSIDAFDEIVERYRRANITEFIFYYPFKDEQLPVFKDVAENLIPNLRVGP
jgi:alkanesulfonate monooxygenase SsuD/methylene tetrahydromethanopterin reductase-like flavin-dependent oxidoreductase (luciferase family)